MKKHILTMLRAGTDIIPQNSRTCLAGGAQGRADAYKFED